MLSSRVWASRSLTSLASFTSFTSASCQSVGLVATLLLAVPLAAPLVAPLSAQPGGTAGEVAPVNGECPVGSVSTVLQGEAATICSCTNKGSATSREQ